MLIQGDFNTFEARFYCKKSYFNNFLSVDKNLVLSKINDFYELVENKKSNSYTMLLERYINAILFTLDCYKVSFDEKLLILIGIIDPNLEMLKLYKKYNIPKSKDIDEAKDESEKINLETERKNLTKIFAYEARKQFGFFNPDFLKFENIWAKKYKSLYFFETTKDYLVKLKKELNNDDGTVLSKSRMDELNSLAEDYKKSSKDYVKDVIKTVSEENIFKLNNIIEKIYLILRIIDPNYSLMEIYELNSNWDDIKDECIKEFGFFEEELINLEQIFTKKVNLGENIHKF